MSQAITSNAATIRAGVANPDLAAAILRVALGVLFLAHAGLKIFVFTPAGTAGFFFSNAGGGWEFPAFWAVTLIVQALLGDGAYALGRRRA